MPLRTNLVFWLLTLLVLVGAILSISERSKVTEEVSLQKVFKASQDFLYESLERLEIDYPNLFKVDDTAGQKTLSIKKDLDPMLFLKNCYKSQS